MVSTTGLAFPMGSGGVNGSGSGSKATLRSSLATTTGGGALTPDSSSGLTLTITWGGVG